MLVINESRGGGMCGYAGSGMFDTLGRKLFSSGLKRIISSGASSAIAHKVADAVVNGAKSATRKAAEFAAKEAISAVTPYVKDTVKKIVGLKRSLVPVATDPPPLHQVDSINLKKARLDINSLIDGSGIILD